MEAGSSTDAPPPAGVSSSTDAPAAEAAAGGGDAPKATGKWSTSLIFKVLTEERQTSDMIQKALCARYGDAIVPPVKVIAAQLTSRGEKMGAKKVKVKKAIFWTKAKTPKTSPELAPV